jgi:methylation protein EvaC
VASCLICGASFSPFINFGKMPIANGFLTPEQFEQEPFFDLKVGYCPHCHMVQLTDPIEPGKLFHANYAYFSSISQHMARHFEAFATSVRRRYLRHNDPFVAEIGSNDGILLQHFAAAGIRHLGVEPSANVAAAATAKGIQTIVEFFNDETAATIRATHGQADLILGANVFCHLPDMHSIMRGVGALLKDDGLLIFEDPYLGDIVEKVSYDQIYDEHYFYFSLHGLRSLFARYDMELVDVLPQAVHGGSMRYVVARAGSWPVQPSVHQQLAYERELGLNQALTFDRLRERIYESRARLVSLLTELRSQGKRIVGYGATSKSTTVTNFCGIGPDLIEFVSDTTPTKQGKFTPGAHIPVVTPDRFSQPYPDYALLFAWNHGHEIAARERAFGEQGGKFIFYVPTVQVFCPAP